MAQPALAARVAPQVFVSVKSAGLALAIEMPVMLSKALPVFDSVSTCAVEVPPTLVPGKLRPAGVRLAMEAGTAAPEPVRAAVCGEPEALSATESKALKFVTVAGVKVMEMVQAADAASVVPQLFVCAKSVGLAPVMEMAMPVSTALPVFDRVIFEGPLVVFTV